MELKDAVKKAAELTRLMLSVGDVEAAEAINLTSYNFAIEGVSYDDDKGLWTVEVGFTQPWDRRTGGLAVIATGGEGGLSPRTYKKISFRDDGQFVSIQDE